MKIKNFTKQVEFAKGKFGDLKDGSGTLIFDHAVRVFNFLVIFLTNEKLSPKDIEIIALAGLFHDLLEDTKTTEQEVLEMSSQETLSIVKEMTIDFTDRTIKEAVKPLYSTSDECTLVKLADIYDNTKKSNFVIRINGAKWYETFFIPLLNEYLILIDHKEREAGKYLPAIKKLASIVRQEIQTLKGNIEAYRLTS